jgi:hypothetical protein
MTLELLLPDATIRSATCGGRKRRSLPMRSISPTDRPAFERSAGSSGLAARPNRISLKPAHQLRGSVEGCHYPQKRAIETVDSRPISPTQLDRTFRDSFEHRAKIERRATDNLEHIRCRDLMLERFGEVGSAFSEVRSTLTKLAEQPRILAARYRMPEFGIAHTGGFLQHRVKHCMKFAGELLIT